MKLVQNHLTFEEIGSLNEISDLRNQYLNDLLEAQELYLELMIRKSKIVVIKSDDCRIGYFSLGDGSVLLEYYVVPDHQDQVDALLEIIIKKFSVQKALCKSFDHTLLSCCIKFQKNVKAIGIHFRERKTEVAQPIAEEVTCRLAKDEDEQRIIDINEEVFDHDEEVGDYIGKNQVFLFEKDNETIGFGIFSRVIEGRPEFDIGVLVDKRFRKKGYGEYIIRYLTDYCKQNGWRAICGCAIENVGSRRCLENAGFVGRYRLLEFIF